MTRTYVPQCLTTYTLGITEVSGVSSFAGRDAVVWRFAEGGEVGLAVGCRNPALEGWMEGWMNREIWWWMYLSGPRWNRQANGNGQVGGWEGTRELLSQAAQGEEGSAEGLGWQELDRVASTPNCSWRLLGKRLKGYPRYILLLKVTGTD